MPLILLSIRFLLCFQVVRNATSGGAEVISPNAVRQAKFHWDCPTLKGVPLENQGEAFGHSLLHSCSVLPLVSLPAAV